MSIELLTEKLLDELDLNYELKERLKLNENAVQRLQTDLRVCKIHENKLEEAEDVKRNLLGAR